MPAALIAWALVLLLAQALPAAAGGPIVLNDDGGWCWFQDERALVVGDTLLVGSVASGRDDPERRGKMGLYGRKRVEGELQWDVVKANLFKAYAYLGYGHSAAEADAGGT